MYLSVGYPLGFVSEAGNQVAKHLFELQDRHFELGLESMKFWFHASSLNDTSMEKFANLKRLVQERVVIKYETNAELYEQIKNLKMIRQGQPIIYGADDNPTPTIIAGVCGTGLTNDQFKVWRMASPNKTIGEIYNSLKNYLGIDDFVQAILLLKSAILVYLI